MSLANLRELFVYELRDIYDAEKRIAKALPKMAKAASSTRLRTAFESHLNETEKQIARLERVFEFAQTPARGKKCVGMVGLLNEGSELLKDDGETSVLDAALISAAQKVEHYEIAVYGTLVAYAKRLGLKQATRLLQQTLAEENKTDERLTQLATSVNQSAEAPRDHNGTPPANRRTEPPSRRNGRRNPDPITGAPGAHPGGVAIGTAAAGAALGAAGGAIAGPVGAAVGAIVGGVAGGYAGKATAEYVQPTTKADRPRRRAKAARNRPRPAKTARRRPVERSSR
jgi:ferritin-like metal-binding protein YciE